MFGRKIKYSKSYLREKIPRSIKLKNRDIHYTMIISGRARNVSLRISEKNGLEVVVPRRHSPERVTKFIHEKENWIIKHLDKNEIKKQSAKKNELKDGSIINILGSPKTVRILPTRKSRPFVKEARALKFTSDNAYFDNEEILVYVPNKVFVSPESIQNAKQALEKHLRIKAKKIFSIRTSHIAQSMGLKYKNITVKAQKTRWGSCSRDKNLNFNWRLIMAGAEIMDSIIVHELAHLKYLNHGPRFYELVEKHCPDHRRLSKKLHKTQFVI